MPSYDNIASAYSMIVDGSPHTVSLDTTGATNEGGVSNSEAAQFSSSAGVWMKLDLNGLSGHYILDVSMVKTGGTGFNAYGAIVGPRFMGFNATKTFFGLEYFAEVSDPLQPTPGLGPVTGLLLGAGQKSGYNPEHRRSADGRYYIRFSRYSGASADGQADVTYTVTSYDSPSGGSDNSFWADALLLTGTGSREDDNTASTLEDYSYEAIGPHHFWYKIEMPNPGGTISLNLNSDTVGDAISDALLYLFWDSDGTAESQFDLFYTGVELDLDESIVLPNARAGTYYFSVSGNWDDDETGSYQLSWDISETVEAEADLGATAFSKVRFVDA